MIYYLQLVKSFARRWCINGFTFDGETAAQAAQAKLYAALRTNEDDLRAALNVSAFLTMSLAEQKTYLFNVLDLRWDIDTVLAALREWANKNGQGEKIERLEHLVRPLYPPKVQAGPEVLDAIEKNCAICGATPSATSNESGPPRKKTPLRT